MRLQLAFFPAYPQFQVGGNSATIEEIDQFGRAKEKEILEIR